MHRKSTRNLIILKNGTRLLLEHRLISSTSRSNVGFKGRNFVF